MLERYRGVLFDKDGTLIDLHASWVGAGVHTLDVLCTRAGAPERRDELLREGGYDPVEGRLEPDSLWAAGTTEGLVAHWIQRLGMSADLQPEMLDLMTERASDTVRPLADLQQLFDHLHDRGLTIGLATMDLAASAERCLRRLALEQRVDFVCGCDSGYGHKPGPGMALAFCEQAGLLASELLVVGDTPHDMHMGRAAGAAGVVGVLSGAASAAALRPLADHVLENVSALPALLESGLSRDR